jgi:hypothetical protein
MDGEWLTYGQAAERLRTTAEGARQRAIRKRWPRQIGNDGLARVRPPDGWPNPGRTPAERPNRNPVRTPAEPGSDAHLVDALEAHIATLKARLAAADEREARLCADLAAERATAAQALEAFADLAARLEALAAERSRGWWRWAVIRGRAA